MLTRRSLLKNGGLAALAAGTAATGSFAPGRAAAMVPPLGFGGRRRVLVTVFLRGGMDGLMAVSPLDEDGLRSLRPGLAMSAAAGAANGAPLELDGAFGLHPALGKLMPLWRDGRLAIVHATGLPVPTRSHVEARAWMECGALGGQGAESGWLDRAAGLLGHKASPWRSVALAPTLPLSLCGSRRAQAVERLADLEPRLPSGRSATASAGGGSDLAYPDSRLGHDLRRIAILIKAQAGLEIAFAESGGWDTHVRQGTSAGAFARRAGDLAASLAAFWADLGEWRDEVLVTTSTEFGRAVRENGAGGTEHGHGSCVFVLGNRVEGGKVHGRFPGLRPGDLFEGRDLPVTTDFRAVLAGVARDHLGIRDDGSLFPDWQGQPVELIRPAGYPDRNLLSG